MLTHIVETHQLSQNSKSRPVGILCSALVEEVNDGFMRVQYDYSRSEDIESDQIPCIVYASQFRLRLRVGRWDKP